MSAGETVALPTRADGPPGRPMPLPGMPTRMWPPRGIATESGGPAIEKASPGEKWMAFLLGLGTRLQVQVIGYLPFTEIFLLLSFPFVIGRINDSGALRRTRWMLPLLVVWLFSQVFSDVYRETQWTLAARGVARVVIFFLAIPFFTWFLRRACYDKVLWWTIGSLPSFALSAFIFRGGVHEGRELVYGTADIKYDTHWGGVLNIAFVIFSLLVYHRSKILCYLVNCGLGAFHIMNAMRATGAIVILGCVITAGENLLRGRQRLFELGRRISIWRLLVLAAAVAVAGYGVTQWYGYSARAGQFGERARAKYENQVRNKFGLIAGGRSEFVGGLLAISESPVIGYGSWPLDNTRVFARACEMMEVKLDPSYYKRGYPLVPTHSHILGAWVESGVLGIFFWIYVLWIAGRAVYLPIHDEKRLRFWLVSSTLPLIWAIFFSPISARLETSFLLGAILCQVLAYDAGVSRGTRPAGKPVA
jgi:hypothetical protein